MTPAAMPAADVFQREFLELRAKILELGASFDRLDRGGGGIEGDPRWKLIREGIRLLAESEGNRAEQIQLLFSRRYDTAWPNQFGLKIDR